MNILVLYQSRNGHTREAAHSIAQVARDMGSTVTVKSVIEVQKKDVENADSLFIGTWVQGMILFGVKPAEAKLWVPALPSLEGKPVGIFCTYRFNPRGSLKTLGNLLETRGATIIGQQAFHQNRLNQGTQAFVQSVLQSARHVLA